MEEQLQSHLVALEALDKDLSGLDHTLHTLPSQIGHRVMVPVGQVSFSCCMCGNHSYSYQIGRFYSRKNTSHK